MPHFGAANLFLSHSVRAHLHVRYMHRRNRHLLAVINES
jgi:hypothetical protein